MAFGYAVKYVNSCSESRYTLVIAILLWNGIIG